MARNNVFHLVNSEPVSKSSQERGKAFKQRQGESGGTSLLVNLDVTDAVRLELLSNLSRSSKTEVLRQSLREYFARHKSELEEFKKEFDVKFKRICARLK
jgi:hypothetical protein